MHAVPSASSFKSHVPAPSQVSGSVQSVSLGSPHAVPTAAFDQPFGSDPESQTSQLIIENQIIDISEKTEPEPHILILSSGEMTPFEWRISDQLTQSGILLQGNVLGGVLMTGPEPLG